jgi:tetratricopeptide (TPR) repeat protein
MAKHKQSSERWANGNEDWEDQLSDDTLRDFAGDDIFERGEAYFAAGKVSMPRDGGGNATVKVKGSKTYSTELYFEDTGLHSHCTCPHAHEGAFCKHMVAAALYWRRKLEGNMPLAQENNARAAIKSGAIKKPQTTVASKREALKTFVHSQSATALADILWSWAETDRALMAELTSWHAQVTVADQPQGWKNAISAILGTPRSFYDYSDSNDYADRAENVLPLLDKIVAASPAQGRAACAFTLHKLYAVAENADDSDGMIGDVMSSVQEVLLTALEKQAPPGDWINEWFALMQADPWGLWNEASVLAVVGAAVQQRYHEQAAKDWHDYLTAQDKAASAELPGNKKKNSAASLVDTDRWDYARSKLRRRYIDSLKQKGDSTAILEVLQTDLRGANEHSELIAYCESIGKTDQALKFAIAANKVYPNDWRIEADLLRCYEQGGYATEALAIHRQRVERIPSVEHFAAVLKAAVAAGQDKVRYRIALYDWAARREVHTEKSKDLWHRPQTAEPGRDTSVRVQWLLHEQQFDIALALVEPPYTCKASLLHTLAQKIRNNQPDYALVLLHRVFACEMPQASTPYREVLGLVKEITPLMPQPERSQWIARLRADYKIKRNFIKGLDTMKL